MIDTQIIFPTEIPLHKRSWSSFDRLNPLCLVRSRIEGCTSATPDNIAAIQEIVGFPDFISPTQLEQARTALERHNPTDLVRVVGSGGFFRHYGNN